MLKWMRKILASTTSKPARWYIDWIRGELDDDTGVRVDGTTALRYAPVWNAVNRICGRLAQLPLVLYQHVDERTKIRAVDHPAYTLMRRRPNRMMTPATFKELLTYHAIMWGNGRAAIERDRRGDPLELVPLLPKTTATVIVAGDKWHVTRVTLDDGQIKTYKFRDADVLHVMGLGYDGVAGFALWDLAKNSWGLGLATEKNCARLFKNNTIPGLILEAPPGVFADDEEARKFLAAFRDMHEGLDNAGKTALLREGIKASKLSQSNQEAQAIEQRSFQREEAGLWFMLESMLGIDSSVSYNSLEQKQLAELINCLNPWLVKWQEQCEAKLLREREIAADTHLFRFSTGALLRSDTRTTYATLAEGVRGRLITPNEAREVLDLPPIDGGDELQNPAIDVRKTGDGGDGGDGSDKSDQSGGAAESDDSDKPDGSDNPAKPDPSRDRLRAAIAARLQDLAAVERKRLEAAAEKGETGFVDGFYGRWKGTLAQALRPLVKADGVPAETMAEMIAQRWCDESRELLGRWPDMSVLGHWADRAARLAEALA